MINMNRANVAFAPPALIRLGRLAAIGAWLVRVLERSAQRRALARLDSVQLEDIGLSRAEAQAEASRPFWR